MTWALAIAVGVGAGLGSAARFAVERALAAARRRRGVLAATFPWATLVVNAAGSAALGALTGAFDAGAVDATWLAIGGAGVCGGLTTFSTLALDVVLLVRERAFARAAGYVGAQVAAGVVLFALGFALASALA
ncbi:MAG: hypothetical protein GX593_02880 [Actinomycetales bacterium]|nr:hypothetical protein [Actinomycetales bacterium]